MRQNSSPKRNAETKHRKKERKKERNKERKKERKKERMEKRERHIARFDAGQINTTASMIFETQNQIVTSKDTSMNHMDRLSNGQTESELIAEIKMMANNLLTPSSETSQLEANLKSKHLPATIGMFQGLQDAMNAGFIKVQTQMTGLTARVDGLEQRMDKIEIRMNNLEIRMTRLEERMDRLEERLARLEDKMDIMQKEVTFVLHKILYIHEEQAARNNFVLDKYNLVSSRQDDLEQRVSALESPK
jgi:hypothetical protein